MMSWSQRGRSLTAVISVFWTGAATFLSSSSSVVLTRLSGPCSRPTTSQKLLQSRESNPDLWIYSQKPWPIDHRGGHKIRTYSSKFQTVDNVKWVWIWMNEWVWRPIHDYGPLLTGCFYPEDNAYIFIRNIYRFPNYMLLQTKRVSLYGHWRVNLNFIWALLWLTKWTEMYYRWPLRRGTRMKVAVYDCMRCFSQIRSP
jgi:hypothetical protein